MQFNIKTNPEKLNSFVFEPNPQFGASVVPVFLECILEKNKELPSEITIHSNPLLEMHAFTSVLHYGQSIFEGMKAYSLSDGSVGIFRLQDHAKRFCRSAEMMKMVKLSPEFIAKAIHKYVEVAKELVPTLEDHALYLRPLLFANDPVIKVRSAQKYRFLIMSSIVGSYFKPGQTSKVLINKEFVRTFPGGTGEAKTSANYAQSLPALDYAQNLGFDQVLYVDAFEKKYIEELGGMNVFFYNQKTNTLITPKLNGQILHGITRNSIFTIARNLNINISDESFSLDNLIEQNSNGEINEVFATGTAAVVSSIGQIGIQNKLNEAISELNFNNTEIAQKIRDVLIKTQRNKTELSKEWLTVL